MALLGISGFIVLLLLLPNWFLYRAVVRFFEIRNAAAKKALGTVLVLLGLSFLPANFIAFQYYNMATRAFYIIAAVWLGFFWYFFLAAILCWAVYLLVRRRPEFSMRPVAAVLFALAALTGIYGIVNAASPRVTSVTVALPNLPDAWQGRTAVWMSDSHFGQLWNGGTAAKLASMIRDIHPDLVFIGGDFYDGVAADYSGLARQFSGLGSRGTFFITGNHEEFSRNGNDSKYIAALQGAGIDILDNRLVNVDGLQIAGVDFASTRNPGQLKTVLDGLRITTSTPSILLKHVPLDLSVAAEKGISLQISGHTHEGQVFPGNLLTHLIYSGYDYGLKSYGSMQVLTSSGTGTWGPPMRVGTVSEIVKITFVRK